jgi:hypothetical protein
VEHRLRVFENRMLRRTFGPKREEDGSWRKLHNDELHNLYSSPNIVTVIKSRRMRCGTCYTHEGVFTGFGGEDRRDFKEIGIDGANWIRLVQDRV